MAKKKQSNSEGLFTIYGTRLSQSGKYVNVSIVRGKEDNREFSTIPVKINGGKIAVRVEDDFIYLKIKRLDVDDNNESVDVF